MDKTRLLADLKDENEQWEALLAQIGEARMDEAGVTESWSIKDIVVHLTGWRRRTVGRLQAALLGAPEPPPPWPAELQTDDEINAWLYEAGRERPVGEVLADSQEVFRQMVAALDALSEGQLDEIQRSAWMDGEPMTGAFFAHFHDEHEADMRAWLARQGDDQ